MEKKEDDLREEEIDESLKLRQGNISIVLDSYDDLFSDFWLGDIFDIFSLACHYRFNWMEVFNEVRNKAIINEIDVEQRIKSFPVQLLQKADWHILSVDPDYVKNAIQTMANDFFLGSDNSLGANNPAIEDAIGSWQ